MICIMLYDNIRRRYRKRATEGQGGYKKKIQNFRFLFFYYFLILNCIIFKF